MKLTNLDKNSVDVYIFFFIENLMQDSKLFSRIATNLV